MGLGTKNRQQHTADLCKRHLRQKHPDKLPLVQEFIIEIEGAGKFQDIKAWGQFTDAKGIEAEMLERLDDAFETWLNP